MVTTPAPSGSDFHVRLVTADLKHTVWVTGNFEDQVEVPYMKRHGLEWGSLRRMSRQGPGKGAIASYMGDNWIRYAVGRACELGAASQRAMCYANPTAFPRFFDLMGGTGRTLPATHRQSRLMWTSADGRITGRCAKRTGQTSGAFPASSFSGFTAGEKEDGVDPTTREVALIPVFQRSHWMLLVITNWGRLLAGPPPADSVQSSQAWDVAMPHVFLLDSLGRRSPDQEQESRPLGADEIRRSGWGRLGVNGAEMAKVVPRLMVELARVPYRSGTPHGYQRAVSDLWLDHITVHEDLGIAQQNTVDCGLCVGRNAELVAELCGGSRLVSDLMLSERLNRTAWGSPGQWSTLRLTIFEDWVREVEAWRRSNPAQAAAEIFTFSRDEQGEPLPRNSRNLNYHDNPLEQVTEALDELGVWDSSTVTSSENVRSKARRVVIEIDDWD